MSLPATRSWEFSRYRTEEERVRPGFGSRSRGGIPPSSSHRGQRPCIDRAGRGISGGASHCRNQMRRPIGATIAPARRRYRTATRIVPNRRGKSSAGVSLPDRSHGIDAGQVLRWLCTPVCIPDRGVGTRATPSEVGVAGDCSGRPAASRSRPPQLACRRIRRHPCDHQGLPHTPGTIRLVRARNSLEVSADLVIEAATDDKGAG